VRQHLLRNRIHATKHAPLSHGNRSSPPLVSILPRVTRTVPGGAVGGQWRRREHLAQLELTTRFTRGGRSNLLAHPTSGYTCWRERRHSIQLPRSGRYAMFADVPGPGLYQPPVIDFALCARALWGLAGLQPVGACVAQFSPSRSLIAVALLRRQHLTPAVGRASMDKRRRTALKTAAAVRCEPLRVRLHVVEPAMLNDHWPALLVYDDAQKRRDAPYLARRIRLQSCVMQ
jgi:hypothetical protein